MFTSVRTSQSGSRRTVSVVSRRLPRSDLLLPERFVQIPITYYLLPTTYTILFNAYVLVFKPSDVNCYYMKLYNVSANEAFLSSDVTRTTGCGTPVVPWHVTSKKGQKINVTLHDFSVQANRMISFGSGKVTSFFL